MFKIDRPIKLSPARAWRTYIGGSQIDAIHGIPDRGDSQFPEEWIMSAVSARNAGRENFRNEGMNLVDGTNITLKEVIESSPRQTLGEAHFDSFGSNIGVLIKIIDAAERLTIQAHPTKENALRLFGSPFGKTECWHILGGRTINGETPCIYMGFKEGITREKWKNIFEKQDISSMLDCLHRFDVHPGETYLIHGGVPHAIGAGCLLVEIQEPTDYTIRTERVTPAGLNIHEFMLHQGLGFEKMFDVFTYNGIDKESAKREWRIQPAIIEQTPEFCMTELVGYRDTPCFKLINCDIIGTYEFTPKGRFFGIYVLTGNGELQTGDDKQPIQKGNQFFVPACSLSVKISANPDNPLKAFFCYGPQI